MDVLDLFYVCLGVNRNRGDLRFEQFASLLGGVVKVLSQAIFLQFETSLA